MFREGNKDDVNLLGGKGANLCEMTLMNLSVPQGFIVSTLACRDYFKNGQKLLDEIKAQIKNAVLLLENETNKKFGSVINPLLVSVRSGAPKSMPGMMDTILNLGMNEEIVKHLAEDSEDKRFVYDSYRRLIMMYADVVKGLPRKAFDSYFDEVKRKKGISLDIELTTTDLIEIIAAFKKIYLELSKEEFPEDSNVQLMEAVEAVFRSWNNDRAVYYRKLNNISSDLGTAVNVQEMVYGNKNNMSGTGVAFSRNPSTGDAELFGEYLMNAQGEDVVAGVRTPLPISELKNQMPEVYQEFLRNAKILEQHYKDMQDMEFTIENKRLYMLQTRSGKRTAKAAVKIAVDMVNEGLISKEEAILRVDADSLNALLHKTFESDSLNSGTIIAKGLAASPGSSVGKIYFTAKDVVEAKERREKAILVRDETSPEDIEGMHHAEGILTIRGGMTSHAAVVARGMGVCCVSGASELICNEKDKTLTTKDGRIYHEGDYLSLDGTTGYVYDGQIKEKDPDISGDFETFMSYVDEFRTMRVRANADNENDALMAKKFGAEGIGLVRTEHMFFDPLRIFEFRKMILSNTSEERKLALEKILPYQKEDFIKLYRVMRELPVVIRYLDPPLHEFLPKNEEEKRALSISLKISMDEIEKRIMYLKEFNPMMGHRGCRLDVTYPEIAKMQTRAILEAGLEVQKEGIHVVPEIMIPLIGDKEEFDYVKRIVDETAKEIFAQHNAKIKYEVGTMIEVPRATLIAGTLAKDATFFSFGTNDLTQLTYGFSRDDAGKFLNDYYEKQIFSKDPFQHIDEQGVGVLMKVAIKEAKKVRPNISLGVCGEHGGDKESIFFCHEIGLDYVSCSPYRIPIAKLAIAQAAIHEKESK